MTHVSITLPFFTIQQTIAAWQRVFLLAAACMILGALSYIFFGSADVQYYNDPDWREKKKTAAVKKTVTVREVACTVESATMHRRPSVELAP